MSIYKSARSLEESSQFLRALADPVRLRILHLLFENNDVCVCHIREALRLPQPTVSRHLAYLRKHGLVTASKAGLWVHYALAVGKTDFDRGVMASLQTLFAGVDELHEDCDRLRQAVARRNGDDGQPAQIGTDAEFRSL